MRNQKCTQRQFLSGLFTIALTALIQGCSCSPLPTVNPPICVTQGSPETAYLSQTVTPETCPTGWRCVATNNTDPRVRPDLQSCVDAGLPSAPARPPVVRSCIRDCPPGSTNPTCRQLSLNAAQLDVAQQLTQVVIRDRAPRVEAPWLLRQFQMRADPCTRSATLREGNRFTNSGTRCLVSASVNEMRATALIEVPQAIEAQTLTDGITNIFKFSSPSRRPSVRLMDATQPRRLHPDDARYGGAVLQIEADGLRIFVRTPNACLGVSTAAQ